ATYVGGKREDIAFGVAVDSQGAAYLTGYTASSSFPTTPGAFQTQPVGGHACDFYNPDCADAFVTKVGPDGSALMYSTYLGTGSMESADAIAVDGAGSAYVQGQTNAADFPVKNAVQPKFGGGFCDHGPCFDAFVTKFNPSGTALVYSTYLGGSGDEA